MNVLITGGAGFIGSHLADRLLARGDRVIIVDDLTTGQMRNVPRDAISDFHEIALGDEPISPDTDIMLALPWKDIDVVVHAAASYKDPNNYHRDALTNVVGTADLIKAMQVRGVERIIYFQTALMYGLNPWRAYGDFKTGALHINTPQHPVGSSYAVTKTAAENMIATSGLDFVSFRLANCYGPRNLSGPVPTFYRKLSAGEPCTVMDTRRDFVFVQDLIDLVVKAVDGQGHGYYHVSSGRDAQISYLYHCICEAMGIDRPVQETPRRPDDVETILLDPSQTEIEFDWCTTTTLKDGIRQAIDYYNEFGVGQTYTHLRLDEAQGKKETI